MYHQYCNIRSVSRTTKKCKMELFETKMCDFQPLSFIKKSSISHSVVALDTHLNIVDCNILYCIIHCVLNIEHCHIPKDNHDHFLSPLFS